MFILFARLRLISPFLVYILKRPMTHASKALVVKVLPSNLVFHPRSLLRLHPASLRLPPQSRIEIKLVESEEKDEQG